MVMQHFHTNNSEKHFYRLALCNSTLVGLCKILSHSRVSNSVLFRIGRIVPIIICLFFISSNLVGAEEIILWDRLKLEPEIALRESFSDNIYLTNENQESDLITSVMPGLDAQFAITPTIRIEAIYLGLFDFYRNADNFKTPHNYGNVNLQMESSKGSSLEVGAWGEDSANNPNFPEDRSKDYTIGALYADANLKIMAATELFGTYQHSSRRFDDAIDRGDNYDRDIFGIGLVNSRSSLFPLLLEYRYGNQQNDETIPDPTEFTYQSAFTGFRWREDKRLSGTLRVGYLWSDYNSSKAYDGWATDTQLTYQVGPFTTTQLSVAKGVRESTRTARDTLDYYVYAGGGLSLTYTRLDPLRFFVYGDYENRDYRLAEGATDGREDNFYITGLTTSYRFRDWLSFSLGYRYRKNDSSTASFDYAENRVFAEVILFSLGQVRNRRLPQDIDRVRYF